MGGNGSVPGACCTEQPQFSLFSCSFTHSNLASLSLSIMMLFDTYTLLEFVSMPRCACWSFPIMRPKVVGRRERSVMGINGKMWDIMEEVGEREADKSDKEQKQRDGENKRFSPSPRSAATAWRRTKAGATELAQTWSSKVTESYLLFFHSRCDMWGKVCTSSPVTSMCWGNERGFKRKATKQHSTGTVAFLPKPQEKIKPFHSKYLHSRLSPLRCVKRHFA